MRLLFDFHDAGGTKYSSSATYLTELMFEVARNHPSHSFIWLIQQPLAVDRVLPANLNTVTTGNFLPKLPGSRFLAGYLFKKKLRKLGADLLVTSAIPRVRRAGMPVCLFLTQALAAFDEISPSQKSRSKQNQVSRAIASVDSIIAFSEADRSLVVDLSSKRDRQSLVLYPEQAPIAELRWTEKETIKIDVAAGMEYFLFAGVLDERIDLVGLLKAFSLFKKWQQSEMKLVLAGARTPATAKFSALLASYKYRADVNLVMNPSPGRLEQIIAGSYAFVYPAIADHFPVTILQAMQAGSPVISSPLPVSQEWCGDAIIYPETVDAAGFAASMQLIYKDERLRSEYVEKASQRISGLVPAGLPWKCMKFFEETIAK